MNLTSIIMCTLIREVFVNNQNCCLYKVTDLLLTIQHEPEASKDRIVI